VFGFVFSQQACFVLGELRASDDTLDGNGRRFDLRSAIYMPGESSLRPRLVSLFRGRCHARRSSQHWRMRLLESDVCPKLLPPSPRLERLLFFRLRSLIVIRWTDHSDEQMRPIWVVEQAVSQRGSLPAPFLFPDFPLLAGRLTGPPLSYFDPTNGFLWTHRATCRVSVVEDGFAMFNVVCMPIHAGTATLTLPPVASSDSENPFTFMDARG